MNYKLLLVFVAGILFNVSCGSQRPDLCALHGQECDNKGENGRDGVDGSDGRDGRSGVDGEIGPRGGEGPVGRDGVAGATGPAGEKGDTGATGATGETGPTGPQGEAGEDAEPSDYTVVALVYPCGNGPGFEEVLLRMSDGTLLAHYSHGSRQFLAVVTPGTYTTTDGTGCVFTVHNDMSVTN